jgi:hypothetical protein
VKVRIALAALAGVATLATIGVAATAASAGASTIPTTVSHINYAPSDCAQWQLSATLTSGYQTRWNQRELVLTLTNTSNAACTLSGYPGLQLLNDRYQPLPTVTVQAPGMRFPGNTWWSNEGVLRPGQSATSDITFAVQGRFHPVWNYTWPPFYQGSAAYLVVTLPNASPGYWPQQGAQHFVLPIPGGPVRIVQNRLYESPLIGHFPMPIPW